MNKKSQYKNFQNILITLLVALVLYHASSEFYDIAWGTGKWRGEFSLTWALLYYLFIAFSLSFFMLAVLFVWKNRYLISVIDRIIAIRRQLRNFRWLLWIIVFIAPVWFFQYTFWGIVFQKFYIRIFAWIIVVWLLTIISSYGDQLAGWKEFLATLILTASAFSIAVSLKYVNDYPFSLGWSEGNRLWDYSIMFGRDLYIYPADRKIPVLLDFGRSLVGGLPFIFPGLTITIARLWVGLTLIIPYLLLGIGTFRASVKDRVLWLLLVLWAFLFLKQGPIHPPLVLSAALVALAWRAPLWYAIPMVVGAGYFAQASRFTWLLAPAIWIGMLEFAGVPIKNINEKLQSSAWVRAISLGLSGLLGGYLLPKTLVLIRSNVSLENIGQQFTSAGTNNIENIIGYVGLQPYLWYRLLPNPTYGQGILLGLLIAAAPLIIVLCYLVINKHWILNTWQKVAIFFSLLVFFAVGLVASTKIGGGGDLHNMDMFLIGLFFTGVIAWFNGGQKWMENSANLNAPIKLVVIFLMMIAPAAYSLTEMRSYNFGEETKKLLTLTDAPDEKSLEILPPQNIVDEALVIINEEVSLAKKQGDVLFTDQRQLLTFGYIVDVPLVPEYEKKVLMNYALSADAVYFEAFYSDLAAHRFALIISDPLFTPIKDSSFQFGEENNAWVKWVARPVLCYYEEKINLKEVGVQLLVPKSGPVDCPAQLP